MSAKGFRTKWKRQFCHYTNPWCTCTMSITLSSNHPSSKSNSEKWKTALVSAPTGPIAESLSWKSLATHITCFKVVPHLSSGSLMGDLGQSCLCPCWRKWEGTACVLGTLSSFHVHCLNTLLLPIFSHLSLSHTPTQMLHGWCWDSQEFLKSLQLCHHL